MMATATPGSVQASELPGTKAITTTASMTSSATSAWINTKQAIRSTHENDNGTAGALSKPHSTSTQHTHQRESPPALPLDWTRVKRRRKNGSDNGEDADCCPPSSVTSPALLMQTYANDPRQSVVQGLAVMCLHDTNPSWFQGYFFRGVTDASRLQQQSKKPWGLLAVQEELDDCLKCADGGYRRITLTVFPFPRKRKHKLPHVDWTGGDMMRLTGDKIHLEPDRLSTGARALPLVQRFFQGLMDKCRAKLQEDDEEMEGDNANGDDANAGTTGADTEGCASILEMFPDIAILSGPMTVVVASDRLEEDDDGF